MNWFLKPFKDTIELIRDIAVDFMYDRVDVSKEKFHFRDMYIYEQKRLTWLMGGFPRPKDIVAKPFAAMCVCVC